MKILIASRLVEDVSKDSSSLVGFQLAHLIKKYHEEVEVGLLVSYKLDKEISKDITVHKVDVSRDPKHIDKLMIEESIRLAQEYNYDIINFHIGYVSAITQISRKLPEGQKCVITFHVNPGLGLAHVIRDASLELDENPNVRIVCVSNFVKEKFEEKVLFKVSNNSRVIHNTSPELNLLIPDNSELESPVIIGKVTPSKNILEVLQELIKYKIPVTFIGGVFRSNVRSRSEWEDQYINETLNLLESNKYLIEWLDYIPHDEVMKRLNKSKALIHLSQLEACSLVTIEALSLGVPVIYSDAVPSMREIYELEGVELKSSLGYPLPYAHRRWKARGKLLADAITSVEANPLDRLKIKEYYDRNFSNEIYVRKYLNVFNELVKE